MLNSDQTKISETSPMDYKECMEALLTIEEQFDVNSLGYENIKIWPLFRQAICMGQFAKNEQSAHGLETKHRRNLINQKIIYLKNKIKGHLRFLIDWLKLLIKLIHIRKRLNNLKQKGPVDFLFFSRVDDYTDSIGGHYVNRYIDPIIEFIKNKYSYLKVELVSNNRKNTLPRYEPTFFINSADYFEFRTIRAKNSRKRYQITGFENIKKMLQFFFGKMFYGEDWLIEQAHTIVWRTIFYKTLLKAIQPKAVFLVYYSSPNGMALIRACRELKIKSIDIQHGMQGKYHHMYNHWTKIPENGYELLPNFFLCWGERSKQNIERTKSNKALPHQPVIAGYRWLSFWKEKKTDDINQEQRNIVTSLKQFSKIILMSCQNVPNFIPDHVISAIKNSPSDWIWMIRLSPRHTISVNELTSYLTEKGCKNFEVEFPSSVSLYTIISLSTHHVTLWSTVCYEAYSFGVPSIILHQIGYILLKEDIDNGEFLYAPDEATLIKCIEQENNIILTNKEPPYIETSDDVAILAFKRIMEPK